MDNKVCLLVPNIKFDNMNLIPVFSSERKNCYVANLVADENCSCSLLCIECRCHVIVMKVVMVILYMYSNGDGYILNLIFVAVLW